MISIYFKIHCKIPQYILCCDFNTWQQCKHQQIFTGNHRHLNYPNTVSVIKRAVWPTVWSMSFYVLVILENLCRKRKVLGCSFVENFSLHFCIWNERREVIAPMQRSSDGLGVRAHHHLPHAPEPKVEFLVSLPHQGSVAVPQPSKKMSFVAKFGDQHIILPM